MPFYDFTTGGKAGEGTEEDTRQGRSFHLPPPPFFFGQHWLKVV